MSPGDLEMLGMFLIIYFIILFLAIVFSVAVKIIETIFARNCGAKLYGLVWLPIGEQYVLGQIADMYENKNARKVFPIISAVYFVIGMLLYTFFVASMFFVAREPYMPMDETVMPQISYFFLSYIILMAISIGFVVYTFILQYRIFCLKDRKNAVVWLVLSILLGIPYFIFMCVYMNKPNFPKSHNIDRY